MILTMLALTLGAAAPGYPLAADESGGADARLWREDLDVLARELPAKHKNLFHTMSRERFESGIEALRKAIPGMQRHEIIVEMARITNAVGDGHSGIRLFADPAIEFHSHPLRMAITDDGLFVQATHRKHAAAVGARVTAIGGTDADEAIARVAELIARDNDQDLKTFAPTLLVMPEVLHALRIAESLEEATFGLEKDGQRFTETFRAGDEVFMLEGHSYLDRRGGKDWVDARDDAKAPVPLWLQNPEATFWFEPLGGESKTLYAQINEIQDSDEETLEEFSGRLFMFMKANGLDKLILDLRWNRGGNNYLNRPLIRDIIHFGDVDHRGRLFVIIGHRTFSAAQSLVNELEKYTHAVFVGEPTAQKVNHYGDNKKIIMPHSGIKVRASYLYWEHMDPRDTRPWTAPEVAVTYTHRDYMANRDPALDAIAAFDPTTLLEQVLESLESGNRKAALEHVRRYASDPAKRYLDREEEIKTLGYELILKDRAEDGMAVLELNAELHPESWGVHENLGEACEYLGRKEEAITHYKRSLVLNPGNDNAAEAIARLEKK